MSSRSPVRRATSPITALTPSSNGVQTQITTPREEEMDAISEEMERESDVKGSKGGGADS